MATREPIEDQNHEAGDETYTTNKFIDNNDNDQQQGDSNDEHQASLGKRLKAEPELQRMERNGQALKDAGASMDSNDTATPSKSVTSDSVNDSPIRTPTSHQEQHSSDMQDVTSPQSATQESASAPGSSKNDQVKAPTDRDDDEELEEGELKDDDDDSDDDIPANTNGSSNNNRFSTLSNDGNDNNNNGSLPKDSPLGDHRMHDQHQQNNSSGFSGRGGGHGPAHQFRNHHHRRHMSPNQQQHLPPGMHLQYPPNQHFGGMNDDYRFPPNHEISMSSPMAGMPPHMAHPMAGPAGPYPRGGPGPSGPMPKVNVRCRFYSRTSNKCTWGDHCRFEHRDDSPGPNDVFDDRMPGQGMGPMPMRGPPPPPPHIGPERPYPPYPTRHQPYPAPPQPYGYGAYDQPPFGPQHSASPPLPHHTMPPHHWRQQHSPYPSPSSSNQPPESVSPSLNPSGPGPQSVPGAKPPNGGPSVPPAPSSSASPGYSSPSSSAVYERKHRLAYELAPWNDRGYPPPSKYDRDPAAGYPPAGPRGGYYRNHYSRDPYGREPPPPHMNGPPYPYSSSGLPPSYPSTYKGSPMGPYPSSHRYSSQRGGMPPDLRRSRSNKRGHDEDESSWSDSGSEDSILGQSSSGNKGSANKSKKHQRTAHDELDESSPKEPADQGGSGTPPGEPLPEDRERQEMLLNKLKEIEDLMAKKKGEQEDPM